MAGALFCWKKADSEDIIKTYIYNIITQVTRLQKITSWFNPVINCDEENTYRVIPYEQGLMFPLRLYHIVY